MIYLSHEQIRVYTESETLCVGRDLALGGPFSAFTARKRMRGDTDLLASLISAFPCEYRSMPSVIVVLKTHIFLNHMVPK